MDADTLEKYRKVKKLTLHGSTEGERRAAATVLASMERRYPGIAALAAAPPPPEPGGAFGFPPPPKPAAGFQASGRATSASPPDGGKGFMGSVFDWLREAAEGLREGMSLRDQVLDSVTVDTTVNTRTMKISLSIPLAELDALFEAFGDDKDSEIATILSTVVRDEFMGFLTSMDTEDADE